MTEPMVDGPDAASNDAAALPSKPARRADPRTSDAQRAHAPVDDTSTAAATGGDRPVGTDRPDRPDRSDRSDRADRPSRADQSDLVDARDPADPADPADTERGDPDDPDRPRRRRGSRGGRNRPRSGGNDADASDAGNDAADAGNDAADELPELPDLPNEGKVRSPEAAERALVRKPQIGDTRPAPAPAPVGRPGDASATDRVDVSGDPASPRRRRGGRGRGQGSGEGQGKDQGPGHGQADGQPRAPREGGGRGSGGQGGQGGGGAKAAGDRPKQGRGGAGSREAGDGRVDRSGTGRGRNERTRGPRPEPVQATMAGEPIELDADDLNRRKGRERKGRPIGRYLMCVSVSPKATQISVLEGRNLIEHYVSRPADDIAQIHGNIYLGRVQNVLPGMEAAFIDIGTPKNAVLYRGDVQYDAEDVEEKGQARIEQILKPKQTILCQVTKNPIAHKGARLTQEVSLPGRFVVLIPNSTTYGISKRLADDERKRLRNILDKVRPKGHGLIVRTAADGVTAEEIERDVLALSHQWEQIEELAQKTSGPALLYREPDMAVRIIREEFNQDYRGVVIDDQALFTEIRGYVGAITPALADRVQFYDPTVEPLSMYERHHIHEQLHRALDRKVWLPSGGSLIIEHTEALTVIDVNTGKNVGSSNLEETVFRNNLEAADEIAKQLRLRDIGGIIVIDFIDMEIEQNRKVTIKAFRDALARDKTRTQVFDISELGLVEMTRKRIGEGLLEGFTTMCPECEGRGLLIDEELLR